MPVVSRHVLAACGVLVALFAEGHARADAASPVSHRDSLFDVAIRGDDVFVVGYPGILLHSSDRGTRFERIDVGTSQALFAIDVLDDGRAVVVGRGGLVLTRDDTDDAGGTWTRRDSGTDASLFDVDMTKDGRAWAVGHFGTILHSRDGGHTWSPQSYDSRLPVQEGSDRATHSTAEEENEGAAAEARLNGVSFVDHALGFVVGEFGLVLQTEDGGATWKRLAAPTGKLLFDVYADALRVVVVGAEGTWITSRDGGASWTDVQSGTSEHLLAATVRSDGCVVAGYDGLVLLSPDSSDRIERRQSGTHAWLASVAFATPSLGFVAGGNGTFWRTRDGGRSFQRVLERETP